MRNELENFICSPILTVMFLMIMIISVFNHKENVLFSSFVKLYTAGYCVMLFIFALFQLPMETQYLVCNIGLFAYDLILWVVF